MQKNLASDTSGIQIIPTTERHVEDFNRVLGLLSYEKKFLASTSPPPLEDTRAFVRMMIEKNCPTFMAVDADKVIGWCDISRGKGTHHHVGVLGMGLVPEFRHKGIGGRLMARALEAARDCGITRVELTVREHNANAIALYKKQGFEVEGLKRNSHLIEGAYENSYLMSVLLLDDKPRG